MPPKGKGGKGTKGKQQIYDAAWIQSNKWLYIEVYSISFDCCINIYADMLASLQYLWLTDGKQRYTLLYFCRFSIVFHKTS